MNNIWNSEIEKLALNMLTDIVKIKTITEDKCETLAVEYIKEVLAKEGIESRIIESAPGRGNLIAKIEGEGNEPPLVYISHIDVVAADESKWDYPPFEAQNIDGTIYGRGTLDTKHLTVMQMLTLILVKRNNLKLNRDLILIATADEEMGSKYGMEYLAENHPDLIPKGYVFNEGGGFIINAGDKRFRICASAEKGVCEADISFINPDTNKAFIEACEFINKVASHDFGKRLCRVTERFEELTEGYTELDATLKNLLEYSANNTITVNKFDLNSVETPKLKLNFRYIPNYTEEEVLKIVEEILSGFQIEHEITKLTLGYESEIDDDFVKVLAETSDEYDEPAILLPMVALGNTDGRFIAHNVYGYSPTLGDMPLSEVLKKVHGHNECITESSLYYGAKVILHTTLKLACESK